MPKTISPMTISANVPAAGGERAGAHRHREAAREGAVASLAKARLQHHNQPARQAGAVHMATSGGGDGAERNTTR